MIENPFSPKDPVNPKYFVNRDEILTNFHRSINASVRRINSDNIAILGQSGIGKTSILRKFGDCVINNRDIKAFIAQVELTPLSCRSRKNFLEKIWDDMEKNSISELSLFGEIRKELSEWRRSALKFGDSLRELWFNILEPRGIDIALLMLDDIHYLLKGYGEEFSELGSVFRELVMDGCNYMLFITGPSNLFSALKEFHEFTKLFDRYILNPFNLSETREAILLPIERSGLRLKVEEDVIEKIYQLTLGHPYFIHFIMRDILTLMDKGKLTMKFFNKNWPKIFNHLERERFSDELSSVSPMERKILIQMAGLPDKVSPSKIGASGKWTLLRRLEERNLIIRPERGKYKLYHPLFRKYLRGIK